LATGVGDTCPSPYTQFDVPGTNPAPLDIAAGYDGALWFNEVTAAKVGRIATDGTVNDYAVAGPVRDITAGPDGAMWYTRGGFGETHGPGVVPLCLD
jgi:virginiamycin B lyase